MKNLLLLCIFLLSLNGISFSQENGTIHVKTPTEESSIDFSPDGDGIKDVFVFYTRNMESVDISVYDMDGNSVFKSQKLDASWDGKDSKGVPQKNGFYMYAFNALGADGKIYSQKGKIFLKRNS